LFAVELFLMRVTRETELLGADGTTLKKFVADLLDTIKPLRAQNENVVFQGPAWLKWRDLIEAIRENPLDPEKSLPAAGDKKLEIVQTRERIETEGTPSVKGELTEAT
jgi:hypothetical protein